MDHQEGGESMTDYYVSTSGDDSNPGTEVWPWRHVAYAAGSGSGVKAGDTVYIRGGIYTERVTVGISGTAGAMITFRNYPGESPILSPLRLNNNSVNTTWKMYDRSYLRVEGLTFANYYGRGLVCYGQNTTNHGIEVVNCTIRNQMHADGDRAGCCMWFRGNNHGILVQGCQFLDVHTGMNPDEPGHLADEVVRVSNGAQDVRVLGNRIINASFIGINILGRSSSTWPTRVLVKGNYVEKPGQGTATTTGESIYVEGGGQDIVVEDNVLVDGRVAFWNGMEPEAWQINAQKRGVIVRRNVIARAKYYCAEWGHEETCSGGGVIRDCAFVHNTLYQNAASSGIFRFRIIEGSRVKNNLFAYDYPGGLCKHYDWGSECGCVDTDGEWQHAGNYFWDSGSTVYEWDGASYTSLLTFATASGQERGSVQGGDPLFVDPARNDFHLQPKSPAIGMGLPLTQATGSGAGTGGLEVQDSRYFSDGMGLQDGDIIKVSDNEPVRVVGVDRATHTLTLDRAIGWNDGAGVSYWYPGVAPTPGAYQVE